MPTITIRLKPDDYTELKATAQNSGLSLSDYVRETLRIREHPLTFAQLQADFVDMDARLARLEARLDS